MSHHSKIRHCVVAELHWLIGNPTSSSTAGLTGYREELGSEDLFSVFLKFESLGGREPWERAKIFALVEEMESRLPSAGGRLILTAGSNPVAVAKVVFECKEEV
jgi:hypothetical protein